MSNITFAGINFSFLLNPNFWIITLLSITILYLLYQIVWGPRSSVYPDVSSNPNWNTAYGNFVNGISGFNFNGAVASFIISYPVINNKQNAVKFATTDNSTVIYLGFNELSSLIDVISNSYYDPSITNTSDISTILSQTVLTVPFRSIQNNQILDLSPGSYSIKFSLNATADIIMNITQSASSVTGASIVVTPPITNPV